MRTLTTPAIAKSPTATLWDTSVPVAAPITTAPTAAPVEPIASDDKPPFDVPDEPVAEVKAEPLPVKEVEAIKAAIASTKSEEPIDLILFLEEHKLLDPIYAAHRSIIESEQRELELENELADLRFELGNLRDAKREMLEALPVQLFAIRTGTSPAAVVPKSPKPKSEPEATPAAPTVPDNAWRAIPTNTITKGVVGLGVKKAETLIDEFPTLGDLCDAMARATAAHRHFADELPKGIGKQSADELANRVMAAQTKGDTRPAAEVVEPRKPKTELPPKEYKDHETFIRDWLKEVTDVVTELNLRVYDGETFNEGFDAAREGATAFDCPEGLKREYQIEWLCGWLCYDKFHRTEQATETTDEIVDPETDLHLRMVESGVDWLNDHPEELSVDKSTDREIWQVGFDAAYEGAVAADCPREVATTSEESAITEAKQVDWLRGWCAAMIEIAKGATEPTPANTHDDVPPILSAETESKLIAAATTPTASESAQVETDEPSTLEEPDDIADLAAKVKADPDRRSRTCRDSWEQGYQAAVDEYPLESFPDIPLPELTDWVRGWVAGSEVDFAGL